MQYFWKGFEKQGENPVMFKKHVIVLYWEPGKDSAATRNKFKTVAMKFPSVKVKLINIKKNPIKPKRHNVDSFPTVLLLKDGKEVDRFSNIAESPTVLEHIFRKANV